MNGADVGAAYEQIGATCRPSVVYVLAALLHLCRTKPHGFTITKDLVPTSGLSNVTVRTALTVLEGQRIVKRHQYDGRARRWTFSVDVARVLHAAAVDDKTLPLFGE